MKFIRYTDIPQDRRKDVTYMRMVTADKPFKAETRRNRGTAGGDRINYPFEVSTKTAELATAKLLFNSVISTPNAKFMSLDIKDFFLTTKKMLRPEYMRIPLSTIPQAIIEQYNLLELQSNGFVYVQIDGGMYGLPQAARLANDLLIPRLEKAGYFQSKHTPGLFKHTTRPVMFCLIVDDFGVQYTGDDNAQHLLKTLEEHYTVTTDYSGTEFCGLHLEWDYVQRKVRISMPGYVARALQRFAFTSTRKINTPHKHTVPQYSAKVQMTNPDNTPPLPATAITTIREIIGVFLYYARAIDNTMLVALGTLGAQQSKGTEATMDACIDLLNYAATNPEAIVEFVASDMVLHIDTDASYLSESEARSRAGGYFYLGNQPSQNKPIINGPIHIVSTIMRNVMASAAEAEVGAAFLNAQQACSFRNTLSDMGYSQPPTSMKTDNNVAQGIIHGTVKQKRSKAIDMRFYWLRDRVSQKQFTIYWKPGVCNMADYYTKHFAATHHKDVRPIYLKEDNSDEVRARFLSQHNSDTQH